jgi:hypothetical protein
VPPEGRGHKGRGGGVASLITALVVADQEHHQTLRGLAWRLAPLACSQQERGHDQGRSCFGHHARRWWVHDEMGLHHGSIQARSANLCASVPAAGTELMLCNHSRWDWLQPQAVWIVGGSPCMLCGLTMGSRQPPPFD